MATPFNPHDVHLGLWTNWSYGSVRGSTLTLTRDHGALLTAFIAMFVGYAGTRAWRIICWFVHLSASNDLPQHATYHQRQAILRNSSSADAAFWDFVFVSWAWRHISRRRLLSHIMPLLVLSACLSLSFTAAGIFSSQVSRAMVRQWLVCLAMLMHCRAMKYSSVGTIAPWTDCLLTLKTLLLRLPARTLHRHKSFKML